MNKIIIGLLTFASISAFADSGTVLGRTAAIVAAYTPLTAEKILASEFSLNRRIVDNYVAKEFTMSLNHDLKKEFGQCAEGPDADDEVTSILILAKQIGRTCGL